MPDIDNVTFSLGYIFCLARLGGGGSVRIKGEQRAACWYGRRGGWVCFLIFQLAFFYFLIFRSIFFFGVGGL